MQGPAGLVQGAPRPAQIRVSAETSEDLMHRVVSGTPDLPRAIPGAAAAVRAPPNALPRQSVCHRVRRGGAAEPLRARPSAAVPDHAWPRPTAARIQSGVSSLGSRLGSIRFPAPLGPPPVPIQVRNPKSIRHFTFAIRNACTKVGVVAFLRAVPVSVSQLGDRRSRGDGTWDPQTRIQGVWRPQGYCSVPPLPSNATRRVKSQESRPLLVLEKVSLSLLFPHEESKIFSTRFTR